MENTGKVIWNADEKLPKIVKIKCGDGREKHKLIKLGKLGNIEKKKSAGEELPQ